MKNDTILTSLVNFLVPLILIYAFFSLVDCLNNGFFSIIYSIILFIAAFMIYAVRFDGIRASFINSISLISAVGFAVLLFYLLISFLFLSGILINYIW